MSNTASPEGMSPKTKLAMQAFTRRLCEVFGLPLDKILSIDIAIKPNTYIEVTARLALSEEQGEVIITELREFELHLKGD